MPNDQFVYMSVDQDMCILIGMKGKEVPITVSRLSSSQREQSFLNFGSIEGCPTGSLLCKIQKRWRDAAEVIDRCYPQKFVLEDDDSDIWDASERALSTLNDCLLVEPMACDRDYELVERAVDLAYQLSPVADSEDDCATLKSWLAGLSVDVLSSKIAGNDIEDPSTTERWKAASKVELTECVKQARESAEKQGARGLRYLAGALVRSGDVAGALERYDAAVAMWDKSGVMRGEHSHGMSCCLYMLASLSEAKCEEALQEEQVGASVAIRRDKTLVALRRFVDFAPLDHWSMSSACYLLCSEAVTDAVWSAAPGQSIGTGITTKTPLLTDKALCAEVCKAFEKGQRAEKLLMRWAPSNKTLVGELREAAQAARSAVPSELAPKIRFCDASQDSGVCPEGLVTLVAKGMLACGQCKSVWYCSRTCQRHCWPQHKKSCAKSVTS